MKKALGYFLIALPVILILVVYFIVNWWATLIGIGFIGFIVLSVLAGYKLID